MLRPGMSGIRFSCVMLNTSACVKNPVLTNLVLIELMHKPCVGTDSSGLVSTGSINLEFSVNSVFVKPPFVEHL